MMEFKIGQHVKNSSFPNEIYTVSVIDRFYYRIRNDKHNYQILKTYTISDDECKKLDKLSERKKKLERLVCKPETCEDCVFCVSLEFDEFVEHLCKPVKMKHGCNPINLSDEVNKHTFCRWNKDYIYKSMNIDQYYEQTEIHTRKD